MTLTPLSVAYLSLAALLSSASLEPANAKDRYSEKSDETYAFSSGGTIRIANINGPIRITGWDQNEVRLVTTKTARHEADLATAHVKLEVSNDQIDIKTDLKPARKGFLGIGKKSSSASVSYELWVPQGAVLDRVKSVNGPITVTGVSAPIKTETVNGPTEIDGLSEAIQISSVNGPIVAKFADAPTSGSIKLDTVNGRIDLRLPDDISAAIRAKSVNGNIKNEFGLNVNKRFPIGKDLEGTLGSGDVKVKVESVNGSIQIRKI